MVDKLWYVPMQIADESVTRTTKVTGGSGWFRGKNRHLTLCNSMLHIYDSFHICNLLVSVKCENGYKWENFTNMKRITHVGLGNTQT